MADFMFTMLQTVHCLGYICYISTNVFVFSLRSRSRILWVSISVGNGRSVARAVSLWLPTTAGRVRAKVRTYGICGGQSGAGARFLRVLRFPLPIFIPLTASHTSSSIIRGWYNRQISDVPSGLSHPTGRN
jgi:hypothetical protein